MKCVKQFKDLLKLPSNIALVTSETHLPPHDVLSTILVTESDSRPELIKILQENSFEFNNFLKIELANILSQCIEKYEEPEKAMWVIELLKYYQLNTENVEWSFKLTLQKISYNNDSRGFYFIRNLGFRYDTIKLQESRMYEECEAKFRSQSKAAHREKYAELWGERQNYRNFSTDLPSCPIL